MQYIVHRRFRHTSVCDSVNIPAMSECESIGNVIYYNGKQICSVFPEMRTSFLPEMTMVMECSEANSQAVSKRCLKKRTRSTMSVVKR